MLLGKQLINLSHTRRHNVMSYSLYQGQGLARIATIYTGIYMNREKLSLIHHVEPSIHDIDHIGYYD